MAKAQAAKKPQKGKAMNKETELFAIPSERTQWQINSALRSLETPEVTFRKWQELTNDKHFGQELSYIRQRAFWRKPYIAHLTYGTGFMDIGWYKNVMSESSVKLSVTITKSSECFENNLARFVPLALGNNAYYEWKNAKKIQAATLCREFWLVSQFGLEILRLKPMSWDRVNNDLMHEGESLGSSKINRGDFLIIVTANLPSLGRGSGRMNITIVKPE